MVIYRFGKRLIIPARGLLTVLRGFRRAHASLLRPHRSAVTEGEQTQPGEILVQYSKSGFYIVYPVWIGGKGGERIAAANT